MAGRWLTALREREENSKTVGTRTLKTFKTPTAEVLRVLRVADRSEIGNFPLPPDPERTAILEADGGVPRVYADAFAVLMDRCPDGADEARWWQAIDDAGRFLDAWGDRAADLGWTAADLFDWSRSRCSGLAWEMAGRDVLALTKTTAALGPDDRTERAWFAKPIGRADNEC